jgi:hypothetical protein
LTDPSPEAFLLPPEDTGFVLGLMVFGFHEALRLSIGHLPFPFCSQRCDSAGLSVGLLICLPPSLEIAYYFNSSNVLLK